MLSHFVGNSPKPLVWVYARSRICGIDNSQQQVGNGCSQTERPLRSFPRQRFIQMEQPAKCLADARNVFKRASRQMHELIHQPHHLFRRQMQAREALLGNTKKHPVLADAMRPRRKAMFLSWQRNKDGSRTKRMRFATQLERQVPSDAIRNLYALSVRMQWRRLDQSSEIVKAKNWNAQYTI